MTELYSLLVIMSIVVVRMPDLVSLYDYTVRLRYHIIATYITSLLLNRQDCYLTDKAQTFPAA
jgi:hypothetical protein